LTRSFW